MLISSKKKFNFNFKIDSDIIPYIIFLVFGSIIELSMIFTATYWSDMLISSILVIIVTSVGLYMFVLYYFSWKLYFASLVILLALLIPAISDGYKLYKTSERIDNTLQVTENIKVYYNDYNLIFMIILDNEKQPLVFKCPSSDSYNRVKANYLDGKAKVIKKQVKRWNDTEIKEGYYLDDYKFY